MADIVARWGFGRDPGALAAGVHFRDMATPGLTLRGADCVMRYLGALKAAFVETGVSRERCDGGPDCVAAEFTFWGRQQVGPLGACPPAGRDLALPMCAVYRVAEGRIQEMSLYYNAATITAQLQK